MTKYRYLLLCLFFAFVYSITIQAQIIITIAGNGTATFAGDGGPATDAEISYPWGVAADGLGNVYVVDFYTSRVRKVNTAGIITTFAGSGTMGSGLGTHGFSGDGGPATAAEMYYPYGIAADAWGNVYIADADNYRIRRVDTSGIITTIAGNGTPGYSGDGGPATAAEIGTVSGIAVDGSGNIYIGDRGDSAGFARVRKISPATGWVITTIAGNGTVGFSGDGGPATAAAINVPLGLAADGPGNVYLSDYYPGSSYSFTYRIRKISTSGIITTFAGTGTAGYSGDGGQATAAKIGSGYGITADGYGNVFIGDVDNIRIRKIDPSGIITTIADTGAVGFSGDGGPATAAAFNLPRTLAVDGADNIYIGDFNNYRVRKISGHNHPPAFSGGHSLSLTVCENTTGDSTNALLAVQDSDYFQVESWSLLSGPAHGIAATSAAAVANGGIITPYSLFYTPAAGYSGIDSFKMRVTDQYVSDTATIYVTVNPAPAAITGVAGMCAGAATVLNDGTGGGTWSPAAGGIATVGSTGTVSGVNAGTATISYILLTGCAATATVTVYPLPAAITGASPVCSGATAAWSDSLTGGMWSSASTTIATVGSSTGIVTGASPGAAIITYTSPAGCTATKTVTVLPAPSAIFGTTHVCTGATTTLSDTTSGGTWSSPAGGGGIATVGLTGIVSGIATGTAIISYTIPTAAGTGCAATTTITVNPIPSFMTGGSSVCVGTNSTITDGISGGTWSCGSTGIATIGSSTGIVTGASPGTTIITYTSPAGCTATKTVTVLPAPSAIFGTNHVCTGATTTLSDTTSSGTWSTTNTGVATIGSTGIASGIAIGTATISYTLGTGCAITTTVTVNPIPSFITGGGAVCVGATTTITDGISGGTWSSSNTTVATIGSVSGIATGAGPGVASITYTAAGCAAGTALAVYVVPAAITVPGTVCTGATITLSDPTAGGAWSSGNSMIATVDPSSGAFTGFYADTVTITYTAAGGCKATAVITINASPALITGTPYLCAGNTTYFGDGTTGGTWSSSNTAIATVSGTGMVTGASGGAAAIIYTLGTGCATVYTIIINPGAAPITGSTGLCVGLTTPLTDSTTGGSWSSLSPGIATVGSTGVVTGAATGTATIIYMLPSGCATSVTVTVNSSPGIISGIQQVCTGATTTLTDATGGGTWSSASTGIAAIGSLTGTVTGGTTTGPVIITYSLGAGCSTTAIVTVNPLPTAITGTATVCAGNTTALIDGGGGTWSPAGGSIATVGSTGIVSGISAGTTPITYTLPTGCATTKTVTVYPLPSVPVAVGGGPLAVCSGGTITLTDPTGGGTWSSATTTIANINSTSGAVTAGVAGISVITYKLSTTGCASSAAITVNPLPAAISGSVPFCAGATVTLNDITTGGTWSPATGIVATIGSSGIVSGVSSGAAIITYTIGTGCKRTTTVTVNPLPTAISGPSAVCVSATIPETDIGGSWSGGSPAVATIGSGGVVTGVALGSATITYTLPTGCAVTKVVSVSLSPVGISGAATVCAGDTTTLGDLVSGGAWSSSNTTTATVGSLTGLVTGAAPGATIITYSLGTGCTVTKLMSVNAAPAGITGAGGVCIGSTITLGDVTGGGVWNPAVGSIATVNTSGLVSGVGAGTQVISYVVAGCSATATVTVNIAPTAISGPSTVCQGDTIILTNGVTGGTWTSSHTTVATVGATGTVTGVGAGVTTINYSLGAGCTASKTITVNPISPITGTTGVCVGATTTLSDLATGGVWSCPAGVGVATINAATGVVSGVGTGTAGITYTTAAGCTATTTVTVNLAPSAIAGNLHVCAGDTTILTDAAAGGTWTSSPAGGGVATVGYATGAVSGVSPGTSVITYSLGSGCTVNAVVTVNPLPSAIAGVANICAGAATTFTDVTTGGAWGPSSGSIATVNASGMVTGVSAGIATITYSPGSGCSATKTITVNSTPAAITGATNLCVGLTTTLTDTTSGGAWSLASGSIATVNVSGTVTAVSAGTVIITYALPTGCAAITSIIVNSAPGAIFGTMKMCIGSTTILSDPTSSGTWSPATGSIATVNAAGVVSGLSIGTAAISYTVGGCPATTVVTVNSLPGTPAATNVCIGSAIILTDLPTGGTWSSPTGAGIVMVDATSGTVTGEAEGTANVTYSLGAGCTASTSVTVNPLPAAPVVSGGADNICKGYTTIVTEPAGSGTWSCSPDSIATITGTGIVTGTGGGTATISFTVGTGCSATTTISVTAVPAITGITHLCAYGDTVNVYDAMPGGTWSSTLATVSPDGLVTAYGAGLAGVTYTLSTGCYAAAPITINPVPGPITGTTNICVGTTTTLSDTATSGAWSATGAATVSLGGLVTAVSAGTAVISYVLPVTGCMKMVTVTVDPHPSAISGTANICASATTTLIETVSGGVWSAAGGGIATVSTTGVVTSIAPGTTTITYSLAPGCIATRTITINPLPSSITGTMQVCAGSTTTLSDPVTGGAWSSPAGAGIATIGVVSGIVTGITAGTDIITYTLPTGCATSTEITVNPLPNAGIIAGQTSLCAGSSITLTDTASGGAWSSGSSGIAAVGSATGIVTGISAGTATISYSVTNICTTATTTANITINPLPIVAPITGADSVCISRSVTLADAISGGAWASILGNTTVSSAGIVTGVTSGTDTISYTISTLTCGSAIAVMPVYVLSLNECNTGVAPSPSTGSGQAGEVLHVYPNPNDGAFSMSLLSAIDEQVQITITDIVGQKVRAFTTVTNRVVDIKLNEAAGIYILSTTTAHGKYIVKVTVE